MTQPEMLTIGAFARACRLSPKALRLYDELDLLRPARVDPDTGYRYYAVAQLEQARLVAWLRRLGMPLARIRQVGAMEPPAAAQEIRAFWAQVEADTAARRDLATFLVDHLSTPPRKDTELMTSSSPLELRYAARTDIGLVRAANQDTAYAGSRVLAVADGFGPEGAPASAAAVEALKFLDAEPLTAGNVLNLLEDAVQGANQAVRDIAGTRHEKTGDEKTDDVGTTLTAMVWTGSRLALVHIGDSRAYLLRDGELFLITHDHTLVQSMIDEGRLTPEEAATHPQRTLLRKALPNAPAPASPDLRLHDARPGDRYLLCSDGLTRAVPEETIQCLLATIPDPDATTAALIEAANANGGPDNVSCVVADVVHGDRGRIRMR
ncbi:protein phosphatase 2C domain-containing protein [Streptomyces turgidiscabies]|uniref:Transcriptional regulator, MerR family n=1 Tax=Streptomyces turgidiscabies (strain Car8) TaxID=698760 RepID=L7FBT7_STRT8|nr:MULTISPECIES: MerR family transcriptional regulator [Streptomyces]ELP68521.1 transcriptional regulator, MerR family [Streptomyces turgidiscabies Car8]MDX3494153.1 protein phosphatase 2C domain-containing protein [Streptomyces turgidiscabies]GAQ68474.1 PP2C-family Ser/Thr phosphatase [Streptomyces turgidiscabies]